MPVPKPEIPVLTGKPVALVKAPDEGVPKAPPFVITDPAVPIFIPKAVATPVPRPLTPVLIGSPVAFVKVADTGVPNIGAIKVGPLLKTANPLPVSSDL